MISGVASSMEIAPAWDVYELQVRLSRTSSQSPSLKRDCGTTSQLHSWWTWRLDLGEFIDYSQLTSNIVATQPAASRCVFWSQHVIIDLLMSLYNFTLLLLWNRAFCISKGRVTLCCCIGLCGCATSTSSQILTASIMSHPSENKMAQNSRWSRRTWIWLEGHFYGLCR